MSQITPDQLQALLGYAAKQLGTTPEQLAQTVQNGGLSSLTSGENARKIQNLVGDPQRLQQLMGSPEVQAFLKRITGDNGHGR
ncbi:MAG: hypothetical protein IJP14_01350 [Clostridia bacterium]|nr:hypothetical protein [Clostridia bacterium]